MSSGPSAKNEVKEALDLVRLGGLGVRVIRSSYLADSGSAWQSPGHSPCVPELLLLDEPMSNLDAQLREEMHIELRAHPKASRHHDDPCHARPGRGDDHERSHCGDASRQDRAVEHAFRCVRKAGHAFCLHLSWQDEHARRAKWCVATRAARKWIGRPERRSQCRTKGRDRAGFRACVPASGKAPAYGRSTRA